MSTPQSIISVCSGVPLNNDYQHTLWFKNRSDQEAYFTGKVVKTFSGYAFLRKSWSIKVDATIEQARTWSYLFFRNGSGKTYFYFINNIEYINDSTVELFLELDVMQTYHFDYQLRECYVEREHLDPKGNDDPLYTNEGLELGDYVVNRQESVGELVDCVILCMATLHPSKTTESTTTTTVGRLSNNVFFGNGIYAILTDKASDWQQALRNLDKWGKSDAITAMWMYPKALITLAGNEEWDDEEIAKTVAGCTELEHTFTMQSTLNGYAPHNKKLLTHPYNFLYMSNNNGQSATYKYEYFNMLEGVPSYDGKTTEFKFRIFGTVSPEGVCKIAPTNYKDSSNDTYNVHMEEGLTLTGFPQCAWNTDQYKLWLAQTQNQRETSEAIAGGSAVVGALMSVIGGALLATGGGAPAGLSLLGAGAGLTVSGATTIANQQAQMSDQSIQPPSARGAQSGSINMAVGQQTFTGYHMSITQARASQLDSYFDMYGYKTMKVKMPNTHSHNYFNYVKTVGSNIIGDFCHEDIAKINAIFDRGVTFWKDAESFGDYSKGKYNKADETDDDYSETS